MKYEYEMLKVGDADAIIIRHFIDSHQYIVVIDAGNSGDGHKIKDTIVKYYQTNHIDLAICTHPDKDHKDGFFDLLDDHISIGELWLTDPAFFLDEEDIKRYSNHSNAVKAVRRIWNKSTDDQRNLISEAVDSGIIVYSVTDGITHGELPLSVVGPTHNYYYEVVKQMVAEYGIRTYEESAKADYDEMFSLSEDEAKSVIDEKNDESPYNASSLIILYEPEKGKRILFTGDATTTSLQMMLIKYPWLRKVDLLKVPHHGSQRNLNTKIIDELAPIKSYISAAGNDKHPSSALVYWLSKYGDVYSTHKAHEYIHCASANSESRPNTIKINPLKHKIK